ncbi:metallophosphatase family protein [bacterium]|nr:metallophosphatase family protein [bacterium]
MSSLNPISAIEVLLNYAGSTAKVWEVLAILGFYGVLFAFGVWVHRSDCAKLALKKATDPDHESLATRLRFAYCDYRIHLDKLKIDRGKSIALPFGKRVKLAVFGDIHSNIEALRAVVEDAYEQGCTHFACTGDIVGFHANPNECIDLLRELDCPVVLGEHDYTAARRESVWGYMHGHHAYESLMWTRDQLTRSNRKWLLKLPYVYHAYGVTLVHATLARPENFKADLREEQVWEHFYKQGGGMCFHGHTHIQTSYRKQQGQLFPVDQSEFSIYSNSAYLINVGTVGKPRSLEIGAAYAVYDQEQNRIEMRCVPYNFKETQRKAKLAGLLPVEAEETHDSSNVVSIVQSVR